MELGKPEKIIEVEPAPSIPNTLPEFEPNTAPVEAPELVPA